MATISDIIRNGHGHAHAWRVLRESGRCELWHYGTRMLVWNPDDPADEDVVDYDLGWGSVSDQNGLNTAFRVLGLPYRYSRDTRGGGPRITEHRPAVDSLAVLCEAVPEEAEPPICPACASAYGAFLGQLGRREHFRCTGCGIDFSREAA